MVMLMIMTMALFIMVVVMVMLMIVTMALFIVLVVMMLMVVMMTANRTFILFNKSFYMRIKSVFLFNGFDNIFNIKFIVRSGYNS